MDLNDAQKRLNFNDALVRCRCITKLIACISKKRANTKASASHKIPELNLLIDTCSSDCYTTSMAVGDGLVYLVMNDDVEFEYAVANILSSLSSSRNSGAIVSILTKLLLLQIDANDGAKGPSYSLQFPKHPLIAVLESKPLFWPLVLDSIFQTITKQPNSFTLMEPVISYILMNPYNISEHAALRFSLLKKLISCSPSKDPCAVTKYIFQILPWLQVFSFQQLVDATSFLALFTNVVAKLPVNYERSALMEKLLFVSVTLCDNCLKYSYSPSETLDVIESISIHLTKEHTSTVYFTASLVLLSVLLENTSGPHSQKLLSIGHALCKVKCPSKTVAAMMLVPIVQLLAEPKVLSLQPHQTATILLASFCKNLESFIKVQEDITKISSQYDLSSIDFLQQFTSSGSQSVLCAKFSIFVDNTDDESKICWLTDVKNVIEKGAEVSNFHFHLIAGLFLMPTKNGDLFCLCLEVFESICNRNNALSTKMFTLLLYKLRMEIDSERHLLIMEYLAKTVSHKYAISPICNMFKLMTEHQELKPQAINLMLQLCKKQERCFSFLQELLTATDKTISSQSGVNEVRIAQAAAIKELCLQKPEAYGAGLLGALSTIINLSDDESSTPAVVLALDSIIHLCKSEVINLRTVWKNLYPKLSKDKRGQVIICMCHLLKLVPTLQLKSFEYEKFMIETAAYLWRLISLSAVSPLVTGAAYDALSGYPVSCFNLKQLPTAAKTNLKLPASMVSTPFDIGKLPEDVLEYIPGYCFVDLLKSINDTTILKGYEHFLQSLIAEEVLELPRSIYSKRKLIGKGRNPNNILSDVPRFLCSLRSPVIQKDCAVGILLSYEPPLETDNEGKPTIQSLIEQVHLYEQVLVMLLNEVNLDSSDWQRCLLLPSAWCSFIERAFFACEEGRRVNLDFQRRKGKLSGSDDDVAALYATAWMWVRDRLLELIKKNTSENITSCLANSILAVSSLVHTMNKFYLDLDNEGKNCSNECRKHISHKTFQLRCTESILSAFDPQREPQSKVLGWLLTHLPRQPTSSGAIVRGCAAASLYLLLPIIQNELSTEIKRICSVFSHNFSKENPVTLTIYSGIGLGYFIKSMCQNTAIDFQNDQITLILEIVESLDAGCKIEEFVSGKLIALTLIVSGMCLNGSRLFLPWIQNICEFMQARLRNENTNSMLYEFISICSTSILVSAVSVDILPIQQLKDVAMLFYEQQNAMLQCSSTAISFGIAIDSLLRLGDPKGIEMSEKIRKVWLGILASEKMPTLHRLAALKGLCTLFSSGRGLVQVNKDLAAAGSTTDGLKDLIQLMQQLLTTKNQSLHGICSWELGRLFSVHSGQQDISAALPLNYSYLSERSILKPLTAFLQEILPTMANSRDRELILCGLRALSQSFPRPLPPFNWTTFLTPFLQNSKGCEISEVCFKIALFQMASSSSALSLLVSHATPPLFYNLPQNCLLVLQQNIPALSSSLPQNQLKLFLQVAVVAPIVHNKMDNIFPLFEGILESIKLMSSNEKTVKVLMDVFKEILMCLDMNNRFLKQWSGTMCDFIATWPENIQNSFLEDLEDDECVGYLVLILSHFIKMGKKSLTCLRRIIELGKHTSEKSKEVILANLQSCFLSGTSVPESEINKPEKLVALLLETMGWLTVLTDPSSKHQLSSIDKVAIFLLDVCMTVIIGSAGYGVSYTLWLRSDISHKLLIQHLPHALNVLGHNSVWNENMSKILDQLFFLRQSNFLNDEDKYYIQAAFCALRSSEAFRKPKLWTEIVPRELL